MADLPAQARRRAGARTRAARCHPPRDESRPGGAASCDPHATRLIERASRLASVAPAAWSERRRDDRSVAGGRLCRSGDRLGYASRSPEGDTPILVGSAVATSCSTVLAERKPVSDWYCGTASSRSARKTDQIGHDGSGGFLARCIYRPNGGTTPDRRQPSARRACRASSIYAAKRSACSSRNQWAVGSNTMPEPLARLWSGRQP